ncbi:MAG: helix-turn-helix domain-containing protein [Desulfobacterales bacterium]|nr:helix-turn-helix domain-containing protein [Desulfobacterales bacterium]
MSESNIHFGFGRLLVDDKGAASLLNVSRVHFLKLRASGRIDVPRISLGRRKLYSVNDLRRWVDGGCKPCPKVR